MKIPASNFRHDVGESLYMFGNFAIPRGQAIPDCCKDAVGLHCMFTPPEGDTAMTPQAKYIRDAVSQNAKDLHWSRFQDVPVVYHDATKKVLLLGDAAHGFCPALGQGATTAIEDACVASHYLLSALKNGEGVSVALDNIAKAQQERVSTIRDMSTEAGEHIRFEDGEKDGRSALLRDMGAWCDDESPTRWRERVRTMSTGYKKMGSECKTWLQGLVEEHGSQRWHQEFNTFLSSHLACGVVGLARLGADEERARQWIAAYSKKLEPAAAHIHSEEQGEDTALTDLAALRGQRRNYYQVLKLYRARLEETYGGDVRRLIRGDFPALSGGVAASLLHCIINLGYTVNSGSEACMLESMVYLHHSHKDIQYDPADPALRIEEFGHGALSFADALRALREQRSGLVAAQQAAEKRMREASGWFSSTPQYRIAAMLEDGGRLMQLAHSLAVPTTEAVPLGEWLLDAAIELYALCEHRNEFVLVHGVTSTWALCQVLPLLDARDGLVAVRAMLCVLLAAYAAQGCPELTRAVAEPTLLALEDWRAFCTATAARDEDEHLYKIVAICRERWFACRQKMSRRARLYEMAARTAYDHDIYWHKYEAPAGLGDGALGVAGVRDNLK
eukprot:TRINITY_DN12472_c0_g3_i1.p2 TRINITY_DN12472_c0_g3~~TRINITY_DN12472_c0_g3_i1.p2  ORF type:complete len:617 (+),score=221.55 TRINITY_DN12472_c0_g3_i1:2-1852(+)